VDCHAFRRELASQRPQ
jgi:hypothetical protein